MEFKKKLKELRKSKGLTQLQLAKDAGLSIGAIRNYEQGLREPTLSAAVALAGALGVRVDVFVDKDKKKKG